MTTKKYSAFIRARSQALGDSKRLAISAGILQAYVKAKGQKYDPDTQQYEVTHGNPIVGDTNIMVNDFVKALKSVATSLEQSLALYLQKALSKEDYIEKVQRTAARLQQEIVASHPFDDGNGRLSRLMMYKVLQAYYPTDYLRSIGLPLIEDTDLDLVSSQEEWFRYIFKGIKPDRSGKGDQEDEEESGSDDDSFGGGDPKKPEFGAPRKGGDKNSPIRILHSPDGSRLQAFRTTGLGDCGIHAIFGQLNADNYYHEDDHLAIRKRLSEKLKANEPGNRAKYTDLLKDLIAEIHTGILSGRKLSRDERRLWAEFTKYDQFNSRLEATIQAESENDLENTQRRLQIIQDFLAFIKNPREAHLPLRQLLVTEILATNNKGDEELRGQLRLQDGLDDQIELLLSKDDTFLSELIFQNLAKLIRKSEANDVYIGIRGQYALYLQYVQNRGNVYERFVRDNLSNLISIYADFIKVGGTYLRQEDLEVLVDMQNKQLVIYRRDYRGDGGPRNPRNYILAYQYRPADRDGVIEIFHTGGHYERANIIAPPEPVI